MKSLGEGEGHSESSKNLFERVLLTDISDIVQNVLIFQGVVTLKVAPCISLQVLTHPGTHI